MQAIGGSSSIQKNLKLFEAGVSAVYIIAKAEKCRGRLHGVGSGCTMFISIAHELMESLFLLDIITLGSPRTR